MMQVTDDLRGVLLEITCDYGKEAGRQMNQHRRPIEWLPVFGDRFGAVCDAVTQAYNTPPSERGNYSEYRNALVRAAAIAVAMIRSLDSQGYPLPPPDNLRAGDIVHHIPTGRIFTVACANNAAGFIWWVGDDEGRLELSECTAVRRCSDDEHIETLRDVASINNEYDFRVVRARLDLAALERGNG